MQAEAEARNIENRTKQWFRVDELVPSLQDDFLFDLDHPSPPLELRILSVARDGTHWLITLEGRGGRTAEVRLDSLFGLVSAQETGGGETKGAVE
jgi:hypothetical protein